MLTKIIVTILVIVGCFWFVASKRNQGLQTIPAKPSPIDIKRKRLLTRVAFIFMFLMCAAASVIVFIELREDYETVIVHVINSETNARVSYRAQRQNINKTGFTTLDGRTLFVADVERIEIEVPQ